MKGLENTLGQGPNSKMSRLDYFLISKNLEESVNKAEIKSGYRSDHSLITLAFTFINQPKGRGVWKFNNSLVGDIEYVNLVKKIILETKQNNTVGGNIKKTRTHMTCN